jgi:hypothetical protein
MLEHDQQPTPERRTRDRSRGIELRRRLQQQVEVDRRQSGQGTAEIAAALEMHLDQFKTRRAMVGLLEQWLTESRSAELAEQDVEYVKALERAIEVMKSAADVETGIAVLHRRS